MSSGTSTAPVEVDRPVGDEVHEPDLPWIVIVWNDPINLMAYVTWVLMQLFGYPRERAEKLMWDVHTKGKAVVASGTRSEAEADVARLHARGLWATLQRDA
jgi:ATP-dependent Clp protease adaptor protein ClpS